MAILRLLTGNLVKRLTLSRLSQWTSVSQPIALPLIPYQLSRRVHATHHETQFVSTQAMQMETQARDKVHFLQDYQIKKTSSKVLSSQSCTTLVFNQQQVTTWLLNVLFNHRRLAKGRPQWQPLGCPSNSLSVSLSIDQSVTEGVNQWVCQPINLRERLAL